MKRPLNLLDQLVQMPAGHHHGPSDTLASCTLTATVILPPVSGSRYWGPKPPSGQGLGTAFGDQGQYGQLLTAPYRHCVDTGPLVSAADPPAWEDPPAGERARTIAQYQAALADAQESVRRARAALATAGELQDSLESMPVIEQAKGIVMAQQRCGPEEAFGLLRRASQRKNVKVSVLAAQIVAQIAAPATSDSATPPH